MHQFLQKSLATLMLLLFAGGLLTSLLIYYVHVALHAEDRDHVAKSVILELREQISSNRSLMIQKIQGLGWDPALISAMDREQSKEAAELVRSALQRMNLHPDKIVGFDFELEPMAPQSIESRYLADVLIDWLRYQISENQLSQQVLVHQSIPYHLYFLPIGGIERAAGFVVLMFRLDFGSDFRFEPMNLRLSGFQWQEVTPEKSAANSWRYEIKDETIKIQVPTWNKDGNLAIVLSGFRQSPRQLDYSLLLVPLFVLFLLGGFGYTFIMYLYRQTFLPLDKLFLFIKMLHDRNRFQKKPNFTDFPLFRRIANEILDYLKEVEIGKRAWQQRFHQLRRKAESAEDLAKLHEWEVYLWSRQTSLILQKAIHVVELVKSAKEPRVDEFILSLTHQAKVLQQYQICFDMRAMAYGASKLHVALARMHSQEDEVSLQQLCEVESYAYDLIAAFEGFNSVRTTWQGRSSFSEDLVGTDLLIQNSEVRIWDAVETRLRHFVTEYAQFVGRFPPELHCHFEVSGEDHLWMLQLMPQWIESLAFLIENVLEDHSARKQSRKPVCGKLDLTLIQQEGSVRFELRADGESMPIARELPKLVPSGSFTLDEANVDEAWNLFNRMHLQGFLKGSSIVSKQLKSLIQVVERSRLLGLEVQVGSSDCGLVLSFVLPLQPQQKAAS